MILGIDKHEPNKIAAIDDTGKEISYGELNTFSTELGSKIGYRSIVFCLCENTIGAFSGYVGFLSNRIVPLLIGVTIDKKQLNNMINLYSPSYMWIPDRLVEEFNLPVIFEKYGYSLVSTGEETYQFNNDLSLLLTTSGSTGSPKLVRYNYKNIEESAKNVATFFEWTDQERAICDLPIQYTMGLNLINSHLYVGATILLTTHSLMSPKFWKYIKENCATNFTGVPFSYEVLFKLRFTRMDLPELKTLASGGGKLTDKMFLELANYAKDTGKGFFSTYGTTETSARLAFLPPKLALEKIGSIGRAIPNGEIVLIDSDGNKIEELEAEGELVYRGPNVTMGYAESKEDLQLGDEWQGEYRTGDFAKRDKDGHYYIIGRKKRFLKLYGLRVSLDMCEKLIKEEFNIDCACTGTDRKMEIYIDTPSYKDEVQKFISNKTGIIKSSFRVNIVDNIPRNNYGKVIYNQLDRI